MGFIPHGVAPLDATALQIATELQGDVLSTLVIMEHLDLVSSGKFHPSFVCFEALKDSVLPPHEVHCPSA